jgi:hypothetical protein
MEGIVTDSGRELVEDELTPEIRKQLYEIATGSRMRQNHYLPVWEWDQTYGKLAPGHQLDMAAIQRHMADLIVLTDWTPKLLDALSATQERERGLRQIVHEVQAFAATNLNAKPGLQPTLMRGVLNIIDQHTDEGGTKTRPDKGD